MRFGKAQCPIMEHLTNSVVMHSCTNGKNLVTICIIKHAFEIIYQPTDKKTLQVLVNAITNSGPQEDSTHIG